MSRTTTESEVDILAAIDCKSGERVWNAHLTPQSNQKIKTIYARLPATIPIIFLPGIMGSNLRARSQDSVVWRPPNGVLNGLAAAFTWMWRGPKTRQTMLDMKAVEVDPSGPIQVGDSGLSEVLARERGWGTVMKDSYHPIMALMQQALNAIASYSAGTPMKSAETGAVLRGDWRKSGMIDPMEYGERSGLPALTKAELVRAAHYQFDVWCAGYNWLQSNRDSGADVKKYIDEAVLKYYEDKKIQAEKVILVTHSMGGLVARALTELHRYDKVLGVVHGVQPATGAPAFYHHARCGYEGVAQVILGRNAGEVTAVIANAPGALELAPSFDHDNGKPWLFLRDSTSDRVTSLPSKDNPYSEIYTNPAWYGLVPKENSKYLDMSIGSAGSKRTLRDGFNKNLAAVSKFHKDISGSYFSPTYIHYGAESTRHSWQSIEWKGDLSLIGKGLYFDDENGAYARTEVSSHGVYPTGYTLKGVVLQPGPLQGGDGTVPETSGVAPDRAAIAGSFRHGNMGKGTHNIRKGYEHQNSYRDPRAHWATLYSIIKIAQTANWHE